MDAGTGIGRNAFHSSLAPSVITTLLSCGPYRRNGAQRPIESAIESVATVDDREEFPRTPEFGKLMQVFIVLNGRSGDDFLAARRSSLI
jgi:hypothetical protein